MAESKGVLWEKPKIWPEERGRDLVVGAKIKPLSFWENQVLARRPYDLTFFPPYWHSHPRRCRQNYHWRPSFSTLLLLPNP